MYLGQLVISVLRIMNIEVIKRNSVRLLRFNNELSKFNSINQSFLCNFNHLLNDFNNDDSVKCLILTGNSKSFFVGLDVNEFKNKNFSDLYSSDYLSDFHFINQFRKPIIGALNGYAVCFLCFIVRVFVCNYCNS